MLFGASEARDSRISPQPVHASKHELNIYQLLDFALDMERNPPDSWRRDNGGDKDARGPSREGKELRGGSPDVYPRTDTNQPAQNLQGQFGGLDPYTLAQLVAASARPPTGASPSVQDQLALLRQMQGFPSNNALPTYHAPYLSQQPPASLQSVYPNLPLPGYFPLPGIQHGAPQQVQAHGQQQFPFPFPGPFVQQIGGPSSSRNISAVPSGSASTPTSPTSASTPDADMDEFAVAEDKRRRNTAASARFRIKKKHKTLELERSVTDLEGRADDLEREAAELRRENGWLKEMLIMKGRRARNVSQTHDDTDSAHQETGGSDDDGDEQGRSRSQKSRKGKEKAKDK